MVQQEKSLLRLDRRAIFAKRIGLIRLGSSGRESTSATQVIDMLTRNQVVEHSYLELRSYLLEIAATLDRYDRAAHADGKGDDPRWERIRRGLEILAAPTSEPNRLERLLMLFSDLSPLETAH